MTGKGKSGMPKSTPLKKYNKKSEYSYTLGAFPTIELLKNKPEHVLRVMFHSDMNSDRQAEIIHELCKKNRIQCEVQDRLVEKLRDKENCYVIGVFEKYTGILQADQNHLVLVNPSDMGNIGTIIRTSIGFSVHNLAIIEPAVDIFNPKVVRASMGALFRIRFQHFDSFEAYRKQYGREHALYPFMLTGAVPLQTYVPDPAKHFSLIFGNEATGLPEEFAEVGQSILIENSDEVDSLNLSIAVGCGLYEFTKKRR